MHMAAEKSRRDELLPGDGISVSDRHPTRREGIQRMKRVADHLRATVAMLEADRPDLELTLAVVMPDQVPPTARTHGGRPDDRLQYPLQGDRTKA